MIAAFLIAIYLAVIVNAIRIIQTDKKQLQQTYQSVDSG